MQTEDPYIAANLVKYWRSQAFYHRKAAADCDAKAAFLECEPSALTPRPPDRASGPDNAAVTPSTRPAGDDHR